MPLPCSILRPASALFLVAALTVASSAQAAPAETSGTVTGVSINTQPAGHSKLPSLSSIGSIRVSLRSEGDTLYGADDAPAGASSARVKIDNLKGHRLSPKAVEAVQQAVVKYFSENDIGGVACKFAAPAAGDGPATLSVVVATISDVRVRTPASLAAAPGAVAQDAKDASPAGDRIEGGSPVDGAPEASGEGDVLTLSDLEDYLALLNRFPGRSVSAAVSAGDQPGTLILDYLVADEKNFSAYAQVSNTGAETTSKWIERFGFYLTQLTHNDDILAVEYLMGNPTYNTQSVTGYYDARVGTMEDLRWRLTGNWGEYTAGDLGFLNQDFTGSTFTIQGDLIWTLWHEGNSFLDFDAGFRYWYAQTENKILNTLVLSDASSGFETVTLSMTFSQLAKEHTLSFNIGADYTHANGSQIELDELGRVNASEQWWTLFGSTQISFYLDGLFKSEADAPPTRVHEIALRAQGQYGFNFRLTPLAMSTIGGYWTVRGYPQSITTGDSAIMGSAEYRLHIPRTFEPEPAGTGLFGDTFAWAPNSLTGASPDWDLALCAFFDAGGAFVNGGANTEQNQSLMGAGVGVDFTIRQNVSISFDYAWALHALPEEGIDFGSSQWYFLASITF